MIWLPNDIASNVAGCVSIACWIVVLVPQLWTNYKRKSSDSLSITFLIIWLLGDLFNLAGALLQNLLPTMIVLAFYYNIADVILLIQVFYYRYFARNDIHDELVTINEETPLVPRARKQPNSRGTSSHFLEIMASILCVCMTGITAYYFWSEKGGMDYGDGLNGADNENAEMDGFYLITGDSGQTPIVLLGQTLGWLSAILYLGSRIPQIMKNYNNKSCEGLSIVMFCFSVLGNAMYCLSILLHSIETKFILIQLPWLIGSGGTLIFDFMIFTQFYIYRNKKTSVNGTITFTPSRSSIIIEDDDSMKENLV